MKNYSIARLNKVAEIGKTVSRRTGAGINISTFTPTGTLFYGSYNRTMTQTYQITGTDLADTIAIVIRHTDAIDDSTQVKLNGTLYAIQSIAYDDEPKELRTMKLFEYTAYQGELNGIIDKFMMLHRWQVGFIRVFSAPDNMITVQLYYRDDKPEPEKAGVLA